MSKQYGDPWICYLPGVSQLCTALKDVYGKLIPAIDHDGDKFSPTEQFRGSIWRGRDCNDKRNDVYPGKRSGMFNISRPPITIVLFYSKTREPH